jgi:RNA polymerase sigma-70 factor (ECF subfamily)
VRQAQQGDQRALAALLAALRPVVLRYCVGRVDRNDVEDVAQEALMRLTNALKAFRPIATIEAYAVGIASHCIAAVHRERYRADVALVADVPETSTAPGVEQSVLSAELADALAEQVRRLPGRQPDVVLLRVLQGLSAADTAQQLGSTPGAVRVAQHRALQRLRTTTAHLIEEMS